MGYDIAGLVLLLPAGPAHEPNNAMSTRQEKKGM